MKKMEEDQNKRMQDDIENEKKEKERVKFLKEYEKKKK